MSSGEFLSREPDDAEVSSEDEDDVDNYIGTQLSDVEANGDQDEEEKGEEAGCGARGHKRRRETGKEVEKPLLSRQGKLPCLIKMADIVYHPKLILMDKLCLRIINTPQFQRLQDIRQLGACQYMFRSATHTRFQHALGVAHLAEHLIYKLIKKDPQLRAEVGYQDILCVKVAGLCHDLGHGPFSHAFDEVFMKGKLTPEGRPWKHEEMSTKMLEHLLADNDIQLEDYGLDPVEDLQFIKECITGPKPKDRRGGRTGMREFLYDIVNNTRSGMDVDKMDYFMRDSMHCAPEKQPRWSKEMIFDSARVMPAVATSIDDDPKSRPYQICFPNTCVHDATRWFETRSDLHQLVYTHPSVKAAELVICDILKLVQHVPLLSVKDDDGTYRRVTIADAAWDVKLFAYMTDSILFQIRNLGVEGLEGEHRDDYLQALHLLERLNRHDMYNVLAECKVPKDMFVEEGGRKVVPKDKMEGYRKVILDGILERARSIQAREEGGGGGGERGGVVAMDEGDGAGAVSGPGAPAMNGSPSSTTSSSASASSLSLTGADLYVEITSIHWGRGPDNPVENMRFYNGDYKKKDLRPKVYGKKPRDEEYGYTVHEFQRHRIRVFCKRSEKRNLAHEAFKAWLRGTGTGGYKDLRADHESLNADEHRDDDDDDDDDDDEEDTQKHTAQWGGGC